MPNKKTKKKKNLAKKRQFKLAKKLTNWRLLIVYFVFSLSCGFFIWLFWDIPLPNQLDDSPAVSTKLFDRNGKLIYEIYSDERRNPIPLEEIPDHVIDATLAIEDKDFYRHYGFSPTGIARAFYKNVTKETLEGGSTLTQQLVKNRLLTPDRTVKRKMRELALSLIVEIRFSKDTILEMYLNQIPYGGTAYGIGAASELYFGKRAQDLSLAESSFLAGLPAAPSRYSPFGARPELAKERQKQVLRRMVEDNHITQDQADEAYEQQLTFAEPEPLRAPHFALWVKELLAQEYGENIVERGGLRVTTTLDLDLQEFAQEVVKEEVDDLSAYSVGNGAALVTRPESGEILAMVGSKDYFAQDEDGKVNIIFAHRQPGSSIKPLNYALAIRDKKITASTAFADIPTCFNVVGQESYCPRNYDGGFHGAVQTRFALANSYNIPAVRTLALNGVENFINFATSMGISTFNDPSQYGLSLTLGGGEVLPYDMAVAFGTFANGGVKKPLVAITEVKDWKGKELYKLDTNDVEGTRVLEPEVAFIISHILSDNGARTAAFGPSSFLNVSGHPEVSVKTGTTNDRRDNWTVGYTRHGLVLTWVGNNDNSPMGGAVSGVSGASPIWNSIMKELLDKAEVGAYNDNDKGHATLQRPDSVVGANVCSNTGGLPNEATGECPTRFEYFMADTIPSSIGEKRGVFVDREKQELANEETSQDKIENQEHLVIFDPLGTQICLTCPFPVPSVNVSYPIRQ